MFLKEIEVENFRNILQCNLPFHPKVNIFYGDNGNGKTNLLEAIWLLSGLKSFRKGKEKEFIAFEKEFFSVKGKFLSNREYVVQIKYGAGKKKITLNNVNKNGSKDIIGKFFCVVFSPNDLFLLKTGPGDRRDFLDNAISQIKPNYSELLNNYKKVLAQKNNLLKFSSQGDIYELIEIYNSQLANLGTVIHFTRVNFLKESSVFAKEFYSGISNGFETLNLEYTSTVFPKDIAYSDEAKQLYLQKINETISEDMKARHSTIGVHRDDFEVYINNQDAKKFASQGQQRSIILALKLAESNVIFQTTKEKPVILLDDVMSELDEKRQDFLLNHFDNTQVFITCCDKSLFSKLKTNANIYYVNKGNFTLSEET